MTGVVEERMATMPTSPWRRATRMSVIPSAIARKPLMPIMPSTWRLMGLCGMASGTLSTRRAQCASRALPMRMPEALTASTLPAIITGLAMMAPRL
ncbi:hypothetical protein D3C72_2100750 [compost metagenome]